MHSFHVKNLAISINNSTYLQNINFTLKSGDVLAVLGPNGAGKSSLLKAIMGHYNYAIQKGDIIFDKKYH